KVLTTETASSAPSTAAAALCALAPPKTARHKAATRTDRRSETMRLFLGGEVATREKGQETRPFHPPPDPQAGRAAQEVGNALGQRQRDGRRRANAEGGAKGDEAAFLDAPGPRNEKARRLDRMTEAFDGHRGRKGARIAQ